MKLYIKRSERYDWYAGRARAGGQVFIGTSKSAVETYGGDVRCCVKGFKRAFGFTPRVGKLYVLEGEPRVEEI